jgi:hypothetical protein
MGFSFALLLLGFVRLSCSYLDSPLDCRENDVAYLVIDLSTGSVASGCHITSTGRWLNLTPYTPPLRCWV